MDVQSRGSFKGNIMTGWKRLGLLAALVLGLVMADAGAANLRSDGIHTQPWIKSLTFLDLKEDLAEALKAGKTGLVVLFEQPGCGACRRLHEVNFADKELVDLITANFDVVQINMYGSTEVTDLDGEETTERKLAEKMRINFTPTTIFVDRAGKEVFRVPGYLKPKFYKAAFEYVLDGGPQRGILFPRWNKERRSAERPARTGEARPGTVPSR